VNESKKRFVDQLLAADAPPANAKDHYVKEMRSMFEKTLTKQERREHLVVFITMGLLGSCMAVIGSLNMLTGWPRLPESADAKFVLSFFLLTAMALLAVATIGFRAYQKGAIKWRTTSDWVARTGIAYVGLIGCLLLIMAPTVPDILRDELRVLGLVLLGFGAVAWVRHCVWGVEMRKAY
jgi:hypothetical protein